MRAWPNKRGSYRRGGGKKVKARLMKSEGRAGLHGSPTFLAPATGFMKDNFPVDGSGGWFGDDSNALHFYYYYISSTSDHQSLDPGGWGPLDPRETVTWPGEKLCATIPQKLAELRSVLVGIRRKGLPFQLGKRKRISEPETASWKSPVKGTQFSTILGWELEANCIEI